MADFSEPFLVNMPSFSKGCVSEKHVEVRSKPIFLIKLYNYTHQFGGFYKHKIFLYKEYGVKIQDINIFK